MLSRFFLDYDNSMPLHHNVLQHQLCVYTIYRNIVLFVLQDQICRTTMMVVVPNVGVRRPSVGDRPNQSPPREQATPGISIQVPPRSLWGELNVPPTKRRQRRLTCLLEGANLN